MAGQLGYLTAVGNDGTATITYQDNSTATGKLRVDDGGQLLFEATGGSAEADELSRSVTQAEGQPGASQEEGA